MIKLLFKDSAIYGLADFLFKFVSFATFPIYATVFSVAEYGVLSLVTTAAGLIVLFSNCGLNNATQRFYWDPEVQEKDRPLVVTTGLCCLLATSFALGCIALLFFYFSRITLYERYEIDWQLLILALVGNILIQLFQFCTDTIRLHFSPWKFTLLSCLQNFLIIGCSFVFVLQCKYGLTGFLMGTIIANIVALPLGFWLIRESLTWRFDFKLAKKMLCFGYPFIFAALAYWVFGSMDRWMLGEMSDNVQVGLYSIAFKLSMALMLVINAFGQAWSPYALKAFSENPRYKELYSSVMTLWFYFLVVIGVSLGIFGKELLMILTPQAYLESADIFLFVCMGLVLYGTTQLTAVGISIEKKTYHLTIASWITALINFVCNMILIPSYGALGAAIATFISYGILTGYYCICSQMIHPLPLEFKKLGVCALLIVSSIAFHLWVRTIAWNYHLVLWKAIFLGGLVLIGYMTKILNFSGLEVKLNVSTRAEAGSL